jgi:hypothetical protein
MYEKGGTAIFPAMRTMFKKGGYYGMDGKFHRNTDSGTYVPGSGYYFQNGSTVTSSTPPTSGSPVDVSAGQSWSASGDGSYNIDTNFQYDIEDENQESGIYGDGVNGSRRNRRNELYESPDLGGLNMDEEQYDEEQQNIEPFDSSQYSNAVDPNTGFTTWSKDNKQLTNIKKQDPELWEQLKEEGKGARFRTGQTDIQKFGRTAGKIANTMQTGVELAGTIGNVLNERNRKRNMDAAAMNMGSTAAMFTNPQGSSKGDYGVTGSTYGAFKPYNTGTFSYKGMYGKYGMEVPSYQVGGGFSNLFASPQLAAPISSPLELMKNMPIVVSLKDNVRISQNVQPSYEIPKQENIDVDLALQAIAGIESSSTPGETALGKRTNLVGKGGKRASAIGTYQMTDDTIKEAYKNPQIKKQYSKFNEFKNAVKTDANAEYIAAKTIMQQHIKNYGPYSLGAWYYPAFAKRAASGDLSVYDIVPRPDYGNKKTWGNDFKEKLNLYNKLSGNSIDYNELRKLEPVQNNMYNNYSTGSNLKTKSSNVNIKNLHPNLISFANVVSQTFPGVVLSSGNDSRHMKGSKHYSNKAIDIGANSSNKKAYSELKNYLKSNPSIKKQFGIEDIIYENDHIHIELMKKGGQLGGQVVEMDEDEIQQFLKAGGQLEFLD